MVNLIWDIVEAVKTTLEAWSSLSIVADVVSFLNNGFNITILGKTWEIIESPMDIILSPATWLFFITLGLLKTFLPTA